MDALATLALQRAGRIAPTVAAALGAVLALWLLTRWIEAPVSTRITTPAQDEVERGLDAAIAMTSADFFMWHKLNMLSQGVSIAFGILATILTASATAENTQRLKIATVTVTALITALVTVQSTFHFHENLLANARASEQLVKLERDYIFGRDNPDDTSPSLAVLRRDTGVRLAAIKSERLRVLASIGVSSTASQASDPKP